MEKVLRSLIHEKFNLDLRVEIEFLSRRRDLVNKEKQEELIKLLQRQGISGIVPLGPGTNRYAFKLDGFVVKVATDHDGKIDNLKEFKMAKRLYPYVAKTYEVSENGTLLVAEYIQPFESYSEMCKYAEKIREILEKLSSVYLIGDVGITPNNFANWGLRVGTKDPVCLDFAYVYEVSSSLFLCSYCEAHSMLAPNRDFTELHCTNPACGRKYLFEDIRTKIGNDIHNHEIGDLSLEGYKLFGSEVMTELTEERSNYLVKKRAKEKKPKKPVIEDVPFVDNFVMGQPSESIEGGNPDMKINTTTKTPGTTSSGLRIQAVVKSPTINIPQPKQQPTQMIHDMDPIPTPPQHPSAMDVAHQMAQLNTPFVHDATGVDPTIPPKKKVSAVVINKNGDVGTGGSTLAFGGEMSGDNTGVPPVMSYTEPTPPMTDQNQPYATIHEPELEQVPQVTATINKPQATVVEPKSDDAPPVTAEPVTPEPEDTTIPESQDDGQHKFEYGFVSNMRDVVSKLSNHIGREMYHARVYEEVSTSIRDKKMYKETFYTNAQSAVFRSLVKFLGFTERVEPKDNGRGTRHVFLGPLHPNDPKFEATLIFLERLWKDEMLDKYDNQHSKDMLAKYRETYSDYLGIQREWLDDLVSRITSKMPVDIIGARRIAELVAELWCAPVVEEAQSDPEPDPTPTDSDPVPEATANEGPEKIPASYDVNDALNGIFTNPEDSEAMAKIREITNLHDTAIDVYMRKEAIQLFGMKHYNVGLLTDGMSNQVKLIEVNVEFNGTSWTFSRNLDMSSGYMWDMVDNSTDPLWEQTFSDTAEFVLFLAMMDLEAWTESYKNTVAEIIRNNTPQNSQPTIMPAKTNLAFSGVMSPAEAAAQIIRAANEAYDEDDDDGYEEETQGLVVHIYNDDDFDIIKVASMEVFGLVSIPFYTKLDSIKTDTTMPSMIDDRNGMWDWLTHMVPDLIFRTTRPEYFMKINNESLDPEQAKIVILDEEHGTYTMGIYWVRGIFMVDDDDNEEPVEDEEIIAKLNRLICEDIGYGRVSHLKRTMTMEELVKPERYVINHVLKYTSCEDDPEEGDEAMNPESLNAAEAAALSVIMNGSKVLPDGATPEQVEFADNIHKQAFAAVGIPTPEVMESGDAQTGEPAVDGKEEHPKGLEDMSVPAEDEETFGFGGDEQPTVEPQKPALTVEPSAPGTIPVVTKDAPQSTLGKGVFQPIRKQCGR